MDDLELVALSLGRLKQGSALGRLSDCLVGVVRHGRERVMAKAVRDGARGGVTLEELG